MTRDYKSRANPGRRKTGSGIPGWVWFIAGLLVGLFFSGLAWLKLLPAPEMVQPMVIQAPEVRPDPPPEEREPPPPKPRFDFYTILPEMEVVVPEPEPEEEPRAVVSSRPARPDARERPPKPAVTGGRYMLQMGSFRRYADADRLKASLALVGIRAEIQKVRIANGETFHRVRSGPYDRDKVNRLRAKLKQNRINSLVIKLR